MPRAMAAMRKGKLYGAVLRGGIGGNGGGEGGGGDGGGGDGGGGEGAVNTCDDVPTLLTAVMATPRLAESWAASPWSADIDVWEEANDGRMMVT